MLGMKWKQEIGEDVAIIGGLTGIQCVLAGNSVLLSYLLSHGLEPLTMIIFSAFSTFLVISPVAVYFEKNKWPSGMGLKLLMQMCLISFLGITLFQSLFLEGIKLTSPTMATAMPNLAPGIIFVTAWALRLEEVKLSCTYNQVKIIGTLLCVVGALIMSLLHSVAPVKEKNQSVPSATGFVFDGQKILGCMYLVAAVFILSFNVVLQALTLSFFPAPISLCAITSLFGVAITFFVQMFQDSNLATSWSLLDNPNLIAFCLLGGAISGACVSFHGWAMKKRGPVLVSMFSPIGTIFSAIISLVMLHETLSFGSLVGMVLMFVGLYFVLWAKGKEGYECYIDTLSVQVDSKRPLLS